MRFARSAGIALAVALSVAAAPTGAPAASVVVFGAPTGVTPVAQVLVPIRITGSLAVSFHGDAGSGCAAAGTCGYSGASAWSPPSGAALFVLVTRRPDGRRSYNASVNFDSLFGPGPLDMGSTDARVAWAPPGAAGPQARCADAVSGSPALLVAPLRHGRFDLSLLMAAPSLVATRCAGPLAGDLAAAMPALDAHLPLERALNGRMTISFAGSSPFAAHGFAGTVTSTLRFAFGRAQRGRLVSAPASNQPVTTQRTVLLEFAARLTGSIDEQVTAAEAPAVCGPLGGCGMSGTQSISVGRVATGATLGTQASTRRPLRDLLTALGLSRNGNARGIRPYGFMTWQRGGTLAADLGTGNARCQDTTGIGGGSIQLVRVGNELEAAYLPGSGLGTTTLRTRCPGPFGPQQAGLATGRVPIRDLARRTTTIHLTAATRYGDDGYSIATRPHLTLTLTRRRLRVATLRTSSGYVSVSSSGSGSASGG